MGGAQKQSMHVRKLAQSTADPNFTHREPNDFVKSFSRAFRPPDVLATGPGGIAIWYPKRTEQITVAGQRVRNVFTEHWCRDELIKHNCPARHVDFFYSFVDVNLKPKTWADVVSVSGSVAYDPLKKKLYARCGSIEANIATLYTCMLIETGRLSLQEVQSMNIYAKHIKSTADPESTLRMYKGLADMLPQRIYKTGYWSVAFPQKC